MLDLLVAALAYLAPRLLVMTTLNPGENSIAADFLVLYPELS